MIKWLLFVLLGLVASEVAIIVFVVKCIGMGYTLLLLFVVGWIGLVVVLKRIRLMWVYAQNQIAIGILPTAETLDVFMIVCAGGLFLFPGFLTDGIAISLVIPATRKMYKLLIYVYVKKRLAKRSFQEMNKEI